MNKTIMPLLAALIVLTINVAAIGVTPALITLSYEPGKNHTAEFSVINTENKTVKAALVAGGEIELELQDEVMELKPHETRKSGYSFTMPSNLESGTRTSSVTVQEMPDESAQGILATTAVMTRMQVKVPYDGKEIEADIGMRPQGNKMDFVISVTNRGTEAIKDLNAEIKILDDEIKTENKELIPEKRTDLNAQWTAPTYGTYKAEITINYDEKSRQATREFNAGSNETAYFRIEPGTNEDSKESLAPKLITALLFLVLINLLLYLEMVMRKKKKRKS